MTWLCTAVPRPQQNCTKRNDDQRKFSGLKPEYSRDNQSESRSYDMQWGEDESKRFLVTNW